MPQSSFVHIPIPRGRHGTDLIFDEPGEYQPNFAALEATTNHKKQLENARSVLKEAPPQGNFKFNLLGSDGKLHAQELGELPNGQRWALTYYNIFQQAHLEGLRKLGASKPPCTVHFTPWAPEAAHAATEIEKLEAHIARWDAAWNASSEKARIAAFINEHGKRMKTVTKVIGLGLGQIGHWALRNLNNTTLMDRYEQSYAQHLTVMHIADMLAQAQGTQGIRVIVQDPAYDELSVALQKHISAGYKHDFEIVNDPDAFYLMDDQTIVFHCHMTFDAAEIALIFTDGKGLAGLMGRPIGQDHQKAIAGKTLYLEHVRDHNSDGEVTWEGPEDGKIKDLEWLNSTMKCEWRGKCQVLELPVHDDVNWYGQNLPTHFYLRAEDND